MKVIEKPRQATTDLPDAEALIREARQRQRRRYSVFAVIVVLVIAGASTAVAIVTEAVARIRGIGQDRPGVRIGPAVRSVARGLDQLAQSRSRL
jgi:hypothetical protein